MTELFHSDSWQRSSSGLHLSGLIILYCTAACHIFKRTNTWRWLLWPRAFQSPNFYPNELLNPTCQPARFQIFIQPPLIGPLLPRYSTCSRDWAISKPVRTRCQGISGCLLSAVFHNLFRMFLIFIHILYSHCWRRSFGEVFNWASCSLTKIFQTPHFVILS